MLRPPRDMKRDRLVDGRIIRYSYMIVGIFITAFCLLSYFTVFSYWGISGPQLWLSFQNQWNGDSPPLTAATKDRTYTGNEQVHIWYEAIAAYYFTLIACQGWHVFTCKTRFVSLWEHG